MARKAKVTQDEEQKFMLVWHDKTATMFVASPHPQTLTDLEIPAGQKVAISDYKAWLAVPHFARDVEDGILHTEYSLSVPRKVKHEVNESWGLNPNQKEMALTICTTDPLTPQLIENIELHKLLSAGGVTRTGVKVTKGWLVSTHRPFLQAILELEVGWKNRPVVTKMLNGAIEAIGNL